MKSRFVIAFAAATLAVIGLAGCTAASTDSGSGSGAASSAPAPAAASTALATATASVGTIVVDGKGMTVYMFDKDTKGTTTSACTGDCLTKWPIVTSDSATPTVEGVTGTVATIDSPDGRKQVTLDGWPLYYFAGDKAAGDTAGQGVGGVWWVLSPAGAKIAG